MMATEQKAWNQQQKELCRILMRFDRHDEALSLFLRQHPVLHTAAIAPCVNWSFADAVLLNGMSETRNRTE